MLASALACVLALVFAILALVCAGGWGQEVTRWDQCRDNFDDAGERAHNHNALVYFYFAVAFLGCVFSLGVLVGSL